MPDKSNSKNWIDTANDYFYQSNKDKYKEQYTFVIFFTWKKS